MSRQISIIVAFVVGIAMGTGGMFISFHEKSDNRTTPEMGDADVRIVNAIPEGWAVDTIGDIGFGKITEYDAGGVFARGDVDRDRIMVFRRSGEAIQKTMQEIKEHSHEVAWQTQKIGDKIIEVAQFPDEENRNLATRIYFLSWPVETENFITDAGLMIVQTSSSETLTRGVESILTNMNWENYEQDFASVAKYYKDAGPTENEWWWGWVWSPEEMILNEK